MSQWTLRCFAVRKEVTMSVTPRGLASEAPCQVGGGERVGF